MSGPDLSVTVAESPAIPQGAVTRFIPNPCCAGGWWLRPEVPADDEAQPETD